MAKWGKWSLIPLCTHDVCKFGHAKMDRGSVLLNGVPCVDFVNFWFDSSSLESFLLGASKSNLALLQLLFRLEMTWFTGGALFSDTLLQCILCHRNARLYAPQTRLALIIESALTVASLISQLSQAAPVNFEEDFHANLYGMTWWIASDDREMDLLKERLLAASRETGGGMERFYLARYYVRSVFFLSGYSHISSTGSVF
jgi:hypothetical protein